MKSVITVERELRRCIVKGKKALFHRWEDKSELHRGGKALRTIDVDIPSGYIKGTIAIIEYENGVVTECYPYEIQFLDNKLKEYDFSEVKENDR